MRRLEGETSGFEVVMQAKRHNNKLKTGHLAGEQFHHTDGGRCWGRRPEAGPGDGGKVLLGRGLANYYGEQRFGVDGDNAARGREALLGRGPRQNWLRRFLLSAYQSHLLQSSGWPGRMERGWFESLLDRGRGQENRHRRDFRG